MVVVVLQASARKSVRGLAKCPACTGCVRYRALAYERPEIAALWHPQLNGARTPAEVTAGANVPVWWLCAAGHEPWSAQVAHVFMGRQGCPHCRKRTNVSRQERVLFAELQYVLAGGEQQCPHRAAQARFRLDMPFPSEEGGTVVVEFDGSYWHCDAEERDRLKAEAIERHRPGWVVARVREEPLQLTRRSDVLVPLLADPFTAASIVIEHLVSLTSWPEETRSACSRLRQRRASYGRCSGATADH